VFPTPALPRPLYAYQAHTSLPNDDVTDVLERSGGHDAARGSRSETQLFGLHARSIDDETSPDRISRFVARACFWFQKNAKSQDHASSGASGPPPRSGFGGNPGGSSMNTGAREFVPGGANALSAQMARAHLGGRDGFQPPPPPGAPAWRGGGGGAHPEKHGSHEPDPDAEDWGYVDENGQWVSFDSGENGQNTQEVEFLKSQLPSEDDFLDGLGADTGGGYGETGDGDEEWGYYDDQNNWVSFGGATSEYLRAAGQARGQ